MQPDEELEFSIMSTSLLSNTPCMTALGWTAVAMAPANLVECPRCPYPLWILSPMTTSNHMSKLPVLGVTRYLCNALRNIITFVVTK